MELSSRSTAHQRNHQVRRPVPQRTFPEDKTQYVEQHLKETPIPMKRGIKVTHRMRDYEQAAVENRNLQTRNQRI